MMRLFIKFRDIRVPKTSMKCSELIAAFPEFKENFKQVFPACLNPNEGEIKIREAMESLEMKLRN